MRGYDLLPLSKSSIIRHEWTRELGSSCKHWRGDQSSTQGTCRSIGRAPLGFGTQVRFIRTEMFVYGFHFWPYQTSSLWFPADFRNKSAQLHGSWTWARGNLALWKISIFLTVYVFVAYRVLNHVYWEASVWTRWGGMYNAILQGKEGEGERNTFHFSPPFTSFQGCTCPTWRI